MEHDQGRAGTRRAGAYDQNRPQSTADVRVRQNRVRSFALGKKASPPSHSVLVWPRALSLLLLAFFLQRHVDR